jgi:hypothetical protein
MEKKYLVACKKCGKIRRRVTCYSYLCSLCKPKRKKVYVSPYKLRMKEVMLRLKKIRASYQQKKVVPIKIVPEYSKVDKLRHKMEDAHRWIRRNYVKPDKCQNCGGVKSIDWSNKNHKYHKFRSEWQAFCKSCHQKYDYANGLRKHKIGYTCRNWSRYPSLGHPDVENGLLHIL